MSSKATDTYSADREELEKLLDHDDPDVRIAAEVVLEHRYGEGSS